MSKDKRKIQAKLGFLWETVISYINDVEYLLEGTGIMPWFERAINGVVSGTDPMLLDIPWEDRVGFLLKLKDEPLLNQFYKRFVELSIECLQKDEINQKILDEKNISGGKDGYTK